MKSFASDNYSGVHPKILKAINECNSLHQRAYGGDIFTEELEKKVKELFNGDTRCLAVANGTAANVIALMTVTESFESIICTEVAHINTDECGALEFVANRKIIAVASKDGKLYAKELEKILPLNSIERDVHRTIPRVISISQTTEMGSVYSLSEIRELADLAHKYNMLLHIDGARISNAIASLGVSLKEATLDLGVDIMSFGGTKNGLLYGELILVFNPKIANYLEYHRKQSMQLLSKMRFVSAQFLELFKDNLYLNMAINSNLKAKEFERKLSGINGVTIINNVEANAIFLKFTNSYEINKKAITALLEKEVFYVIDDKESIIRLMCSFDTTSEDVDTFVKELKDILSLL